MKEYEIYGNADGNVDVIREFLQRKLCDVLDYGKDEASLITGKAKRKCREIVKDLPEFEKGDRFKMNILSCAMYSAGQ